MLCELLSPPESCLNFKGTILKDNTNDLLRISLPGATLCDGTLYEYDPRFVAFSSFQISGFFLSFSLSFFLSSVLRFDFHLYLSCVLHLLRTLAVLKLSSFRANQEKTELESTKNKK